MNVKRNEPSRTHAPAGDAAAMSNSDGDISSRPLVDNEFDPRRASIADHDVFAPFYPDAYRSLRQAIDAGDIKPNTPVLVTRPAGQAIVLLTTQMAYHHVAQGDIMGHPWLVSY